MHAKYENLKNYVKEVFMGKFPERKTIHSFMQRTCNELNKKQKTKNEQTPLE